MKTIPMSAPVKLPRRSKGKRPQFFRDPDIDQMMTFIIELTTEVSVLYERLDTVERLLERKGTISRADIESYQADAAVDTERSLRREKYLQRVFRMHGDEPRRAPRGLKTAKPKAKSKPKAKKKKR